MGEFNRSVLVPALIFLSTFFSLFDQIISDVKNDYVFKSKLILFLDKIIKFIKEYTRFNAPVYFHCTMG
jgi:hypothetical protein